MKVIEDSTTMPATHLQAAQLRLPFGSSDAEDSGDLSCTEPGCIQTFRKPSTLEKHLAVGNHLYHSLNGSADVAMELWAEKCSDSVFYNQSHLIQSSSISSKDNQVHTCVSNLKTGWALKLDRKFVRFSLGVKKFVKDIFDDGEKTGKKANPVSVSLQIRNERDKYGNHIFSPND